MRYGSLSLTTFVLLGNVTSINQKRNCSDDGDNDFIEWVWDNGLISNNKRESETASILDLSASVIFSAIPLLPKVTMKSCHLPYISTKDITLDRSGIAQLIECWICDNKVTSLTPGRRIFISWVFVLIFIHVTTVACNRPCQKCKWQVTPKDTYTLGADCAVQALCGNQLVSCSLLGNTQP